MHFCKTKVHPDFRNGLCSSPPRLMRYREKVINPNLSVYEIGTHEQNKHKQFSWNSGHGRLPSTALLLLGFAFPRFPVSGLQGRHAPLADLSILAVEGVQLVRLNQGRELDLALSVLLVLAVCSMDQDGQRLLWGCVWEWVLLCRLRMIRTV